MGFPHTGQSENAVNEDEAILRELELLGAGTVRQSDGTYRVGCGTAVDEGNAVEACKLTARLSRVSAINFQQCAVTDQAFAHLEDVSGLKELTLRRTRLTGKGLWILPGMTQLEKLVLCDINEHVSEGVKYIGRVERLRKLNLSGLPISDADLAAFENLTRLESVDLGTTPVNRGLWAFSSCRKLRWLDLEGSYVADDGMRAVNGLTSLEELSLANTRITDQGLDGIPALQRLTWLALSRTPVTWKGLEKVAELTGLKVLYFGENCMTRRECSAMARMTGLQRIKLTEGCISLPNLVYLRWKLPECEVRLSPRPHRVTA